MSRVGFEPTIPAFERANTGHASDSAANVIGIESLYLYIFTYLVGIATGKGLTAEGSEF
jgi:hypothetical protein